MVGNSCSALSQSPTIFLFFEIDSGGGRANQLYRNRSQSAITKIMHMNRDANCWYRNTCYGAAQLISGGANMLHHCRHLTSQKLAITPYTSIHFCNHKLQLIPFLSDMFQPRVSSQSFWAKRCMHLCQARANKDTEINVDSMLPKKSSWMLTVTFSSIMHSLCNEKNWIISHAWENSWVCMHVWRLSHSH